MTNEKDVMKQKDLEYHLGFRISFILFVKKLFHPVAHSLNNTFPKSIISQKEMLWNNKDNYRFGSKIGWLVISYNSSI